MQNSKILIHSRERVQDKFCFFLSFVIKVVKKYLMTEKEDRKMRERYLKNSIEVTPELHPEKYKYMKAIAAILEVSMPKVYIVDTKNKSRACFSGTGEGFVVLSKYYVEHAPDYVLKSVFAHECGHKKFEHLIKRRAYMLIAGVEAFVVAEVLVMLLGLRDDLIASLIVVLVSSFVCFEWAFYKIRSQELTADRCSAYVVGKKNRIDSLKVTYGWVEESRASWKGWRERMKCFAWDVKFAIFRTHPSQNCRIRQVQEADFSGFQ